MKNAVAKSGLAVILACAFLASCRGSDAGSAQAQAKAPVHEHHAPHGGALVELGEGEFAHLELVLDPAQGLLTAYSLDGEAENPIRLKQDKIMLSLKGLGGGGELGLALAAQANQLTGETVGDTSQFSASSDRLKGVSSFKGEVKAVTTKGEHFDHIAFSFPKGSEDDKE